MANRIKGITVEIGGDTTGLDKALKGVNSEIKNTQSQLKDVERLLKLDPNNTELLSQKQRLLGESIKGTKEKLDTLKEAEKQTQQQFEKGEISRQQYDALKREIIETEEQLKKLEDTAGSASAKMQLISQKTGEFGEKATSAGKAMMPVTAGIVALGAAGIGAAMELDDGYDTIITKTGATGEALEGLTEVANNVFTNMPTDMDKAGIAVGEINTRFGATGKVLEDLSTQFIQFSEINGTDLNNSIGTVDKLMEQWNVDMSKTGEVLGLITKKGQDTGISVDLLMDTVQKNGATFKEMGFNMAQSIDLLAQFEANGVNAETAIMGLRKSTKYYTDQGKSTKDAIKLTIDSIKNAKDETKALAKAQEVFGIKGAAEMSNAIREGRVDLDKLSSSMEAYGTTVEDTFNATLDPWDDVTVASNNLKLAASDLGNTLLTMLLPILTQLVERIKGFTSWFQGLSDGQKEMIVKIALLVAAIGPLLLIIGKMSTGLSALTGLLSKASTFSGGLGGALSALVSPVGIAIAAIGAIIAIIAVLYHTNEDFRIKMQGIWAGIQERISGSTEKIKSILSSFQELITLIWQKWGDEITQTIELTLNFIMTLIENALNIIEGIIKFFSAILKGDWEGAWEAVKQILLSVGKIIIAAAQQIFDMAIIGIKAVLKLLPQTVQDGFAGAIDFLTSLPQKALEWGKDFIDGFVKGIKDKISAVTDAVKGVAEKITSYLHFSRPDVGPLREYETWMPDFMDGLAKGIKDNKWKVERQVSVLASDMSESANNTDLSGLLSAIGRQTDALSGMHVVLSDGTLVGKLMPQIEKGLHENFQKAVRG